jgi:hypothetical protein
MNASNACGVGAPSVMIVPRAAALSSFLTEQNVALAELFRWSTSRWIFWSLLVFLVCHANAQVGAASVGKTIPGNQVLMVYLCCAIILDHLNHMSSGGSW